MLGWMRTAEEVGFYSAAQNLSNSFTPVALFATSIFPIMTKLAENRKKNSKFAGKNAPYLSYLHANSHRRNYSRKRNYFVYLRPELSRGNCAIPNPASDFIYNSSFYNSKQFFARCGQQKKFITFSLIGAVGNITFNFLLIPLFGTADALFPH